MLADNQTMNATNRPSTGIKRRVRIAAKKCELRLRRQLAGKTVWIRYTWLQLPYHGDGDRQELSFHLDAAEWWHWWQKEWRRLAPHVKSGAVLVDVGAKLGIYTALFSKLTGATGRVHSFESSPVTFAKLREVVAMNDLKNVSLHNLNCGGGQGPPKPPSGDVRESKKAESVRLDDCLAPQLTRLDFLRIDSEDSGESVIEGATKMLERFHPVIYVQLGSEHLESSRRTVSLLKSLGYRFPVEPVPEECHDGESFIAMPT